MRVNERMKKVFSILLCLCMLFQNAPVMAFAATTDNLCDHHSKHTGECGYREGSAGSACTHEHSEDCYEILECLHTHSDECDDPCTHECTVENGCITMDLDCHHTHGDCGYSEGTAEVPCGHVHNESCGYAEAVAGNPCANAETDPECDHSGDCGFVAAVEDAPCGHTVCDDTCGYTPATEGTPCTHVCEVKVDSDDSCYKLLCSHKDGGHDDACGYAAAVEAHECHYDCAECAAAPASEEPSEESSEPAPVCDCGTDDAAIHATTCAVYVAPENPVCSCAEACGVETQNFWCDVCGFDYTACTDTDTAAVYAEGTIDLSQYSEGDTINISEDCKIIGDGNEYNISLNIAEDATVIFDVGASGVKLNGQITVADGKTLTLLVAGDAEHTVNGGISIGNGSNVIIEGDLTKENNKLTVTATGSNAGIGANNGVTAGDITIRNARVDATGSGSSSAPKIAGAGIGTAKASMGNILIVNSIVTAAGGYYSEYEAHGAAIGMGSDGGTMGNITLIDSEITASHSGEGHASIIGAGPDFAEGDRDGSDIGTMGDIIITNTDLHLSMAESTIDEYAAMIGTADFSGGYSSYSVNMGKIIFTDITQAQLDEMIATWSIPSDFAEYGGYVLGLGYWTHVYKYNEYEKHCVGTFGGVWVSDGNGGIVQIGNDDGYYVDCKDGSFVHNFDKNCGGTCSDCGVTYYVVHTMGTAATCTELAVCSVCGESYGDIDADAHSYGDWVSNGDNTHTRTCANDNTHTENGDCSGGTATCTEQAVCDICKTAYGALGGHTTAEDATYTDNSDGTHSYTCSSCGNPVTESHTFTDGACTGCGVIGGYCGEEGNEQNVIWTYANGTLTISGTGAIADQRDNYDNRPWEEYVDQITTIVVNDGITSIGEAAFWRFQKLTTAKLPDSLTTISQQAFYGCTALKTVNFPANLKTIEGWAFLGCALESVTLPEGLTTIGYRAFSECKTLTSVTVPASVTTIDEGAFGYSPAKITVAEDNLNYSSDEHGVLFDKDKTTLIYCCPNIEVETYTIPSTVTEICKEACYGCKNLATITIPDGVQKIGSSAFGGCEALTTITIPAGVAIIEANTFYDCTALTAVTIPAGVTTIDMWAFSGCTALTTVTIPASVTSIAYNAFSNCSALTTVNVPCTWDDSLYTFDESVTLNKVHNWTNGTCTVCGEVCDHSESTHETATDAGNGQHSFTCSVCENTATEAHTMDPATGKCVCGVELAVASVAKSVVGDIVGIGTTTYYERLDEAIQAVSSCTAGDYATVKLLENLTLTEKISIGGGVFNLDLNTKDVVFSKTATIGFEISGGEVTFAGNGTVTKEDGTVIVVNTGAMADISGGTYDGAVALANAGTVTVSGGTLKGSGFGIRNTGNLTISNGEVSSYQKNTSNPYNVTAIISSGGRITVTGGTLKAGRFGMLMYQDGTIDLSGFGGAEGVTIWRDDLSTVEMDASDVMLPDGFGLFDESGTQQTGSIAMGTMLTVKQLHVHDWSYMAEDDTITATCNAEGCPDAEQSITISAAGKTYDGTPVTATLNGSVDGVTVSANDITYSGNTNAGTYTASITIEGKTASVKFTIEKATVIVTADAKSKTYGTDNPELTYRASGLFGSDTLTGALATTATKTSNVGEYDIIVGSLANSNYIIHFVGKKLTITKAAAPAIVWPTAAALTYGQKLSDSTLTSEDENGTFAWQEGNTVPTVTNSGYEVVYTPTDTDNYDYTGVALTKTIPVAVSKVSATVTAAPTPNTLTYTGEPQSLISGGEAEGGSMLYSTDNQNWSTTIPQGTAAGEYTVYYKVVGDANHNDTDVQPVEVRIGQLAVAEPTVSGTYTYNGSAQAVTLTGMESCMTIASGNEAVGAGSYEVAITLDSNHKWADGSDGKVQWSIAKAEPKAEDFVFQAPGNLTYDGETKSASVSAKTGIDGMGEIIAVMYYNADSSPAVEKQPISAGNYFVQINVAAGENYTEKSFFRGEDWEFSIGKAKAEITVDTTPITMTYGEPVTLPVATANVGTVTCDKTANDLVNVGTYTVTYTVAGTANYDGDTKTVTVTIKPKTITEADVELVGTLTYTGEEQTQKITVTEGIAYTVTGNKATEVGDYTLTVTASGNYTGSVTKQWSIGKAVATVTAAPTPRTLTYNGEAQNLISGGEAEGGSMQYSTDNQTWSTTIPQGTDAGEYIVYYKVVGDANHSDTAVDSVEVTIAKADPVIGTVGCEIPLFDSTAASAVELTRTDMTVDGTLVLTDSELTAGEGTYNWKFTPKYTNNYNTITGTVILNVTADVLEKIEVSGTLEKNSYSYGDTFSIDGLTVTATYTTGATKDVTELVSFDSTLAVGQTSVELTYQGKICTVTGITVAKKQIVISGMSWTVPTNAVYSGTAYTATLNGALPEGVTVTKTGNTATNAGDHTAKAVFSLADGYSADNYEIVNGTDLTADWTIAKKNIAGAQITLGAALTYNGKQQTQNVESVKIDGLTVTYTVSGNTGTDAEGYTLTVTGTGNFEGAATADWSIAKKNISGATISLGDSLTYNGNEQTQKVIDVKIGDLTVTYDVTANKQTNAGNYTLTVTGNGNFEGSATADWSIAKAKLTITANNNSITYGDIPAANGATGTGFVSSESIEDLSGELTYSYNYEQFGNVGTYKITPSGLTSGNYEITFADGTLTVNAKAITVTADAVSKTYGEADPALTYKVEGLVNGDELTGELKRAAGENVGSYAIEQNTLTVGNNYTITYNGAKLTINAKAITTADVKLNGSLTYNGREQTQPITVTEGITYEVSGNKATNAGAYELIVEGTGNYTCSVTLDWTISKAKLTITADSKVIYIGEKLPTLTYTVSGLVGGDKLTKEPILTTNADADQAGSYTFTAANADAGDNYTITYVSGSLTIMDKETEVETKIEQTKLTEVPEGLKDTQFDTVEEIKEELISKILATSTGYSAENMVHYDVTLHFSLDGGDSWILATEQNFPTEGITVILPYPEGTNARDYEFVVSHMFTVTSQRLGTVAGEVEMPKVEETANGIRVTLNGLSPVTVAARYHDHTGGTATCTDKAICSICGTAYGELDATNHAGGTEVKNAKEATCGAEGYTGDTHCKGCGEIVEKGTAIKATGEHTYGDWKVVKEPTKTTKGEKQRTCSVCGHVDSKEIPVLSDTPATGDDSNIILYGSMFTVSLAGLVVLLLAAKKRKQENA